MDHIQSIGLRINRLSRALKRNLQLTISTQKIVDEVTASNGYILGYLYDNRDHTIYQKDIERRHGLGKSAVASIMSKMEEDGLISREVEKSDTRLKKVSLTPKGEQVHLRIVQSLQWLDQKQTEQITPEEKKIFFEILAKIEKNVSDVSELLQGQDQSWMTEIKEVCSNTEKH